MMPFTTCMVQKYQAAGSNNKKFLTYINSFECRIVVERALGPRRREK